MVTAILPTLSAAACNASPWSCGTHLEAEYSASIMLQICSECNNIEIFVFTEPHRISFSTKQSIEKPPMLTQSVVGQVLGKHDIAE